MRALLRDLKSREFYGAHWELTAERGEARDFGSTFSALTYAEENDLREIEVVLTFGGPERDITISRRLRQAGGRFMNFDF